MSSTAMSTGSRNFGRDESHTSAGALIRSTSPRTPGAGCGTSGALGARGRGVGLRRERDFGMRPSLSPVLVVTRFDVPEADSAAFLPQAQAALAAFAARPGYLRGR